MDDRLGSDRLSILDIDEVDHRTGRRRRRPTRCLRLSERSVRRCKTNECGKKRRLEGSQKHCVIPSINGQAGRQTVRVMLCWAPPTTSSSRQALKIYQRVPNLSKGLPLSSLSVYLRAS